MWQYNGSDRTLSYADSAENLWTSYDASTSTLIEEAYLQYQRFVFIGQPSGAPGPYAIHFGREWDESVKVTPQEGHTPCVLKPEQRRADADKEQGWRRRAVRRVATCEREGAPPQH